LKTPKKVGNFVSYWRLKTADGTPFGENLWFYVDVRYKPCFEGIIELILALATMFVFLAVLSAIIMITVIQGICTSLACTAKREDVKAPATNASLMTKALSMARWNCDGCGEMKAGLGPNYHCKICLNGGF
jgi:hypothetical protein